MKPEISAFCPRSGAGAIKARANAHAMPPTTGILRLGIPNYTAESATRTQFWGIWQGEDCSNRLPHLTGSRPHPHFAIPISPARVFHIRPTHVILEK